MNMNEQSDKEIKPKRKIVQIAIQEAALIALCDDGTIWEGYRKIERMQWRQLDTSWVEITSRY